MLRDGFKHISCIHQSYVVDCEEIVKRLRSFGEPELKLNLTIKFRDEVLGERDLECLRAIRDSGSILSASQILGLDYRTVWNIITSLEKRLNMKLVNRALGGFGGGGASLTLEGELLLQKFDLAIRRINNTITRMPLKPDLRIAGSDCPGVDKLVSMLENENVYAEYLKVGSVNGLHILSNSMCDIACIHLRDWVSGEYNKFILKSNVFKDNYVLIRGYMRTIGFMVRRGNPKNINSIKDLLRGDVVLANRNRGSGSWELLEHMLKQLSIEMGVKVEDLKRRIRGYNQEYFSHMEVGVAIASGKADVGIGLKWISKKLNLDFIPIIEENFDFIVGRSFLKTDLAEKFIKTLKSKEFQMFSEEAGLKVYDETGKIIEY
ncbi:MAG: LysR family transcriptional regulator [archaeon YNP-WB-040]|nr:LysR family transcriptional regulator [Candidatus Culexarchaeum yellowstonense]